MIGALRKLLNSQRLCDSLSRLAGSYTSCLWATGRRMATESEAAAILAPLRLAVQEQVSSLRVYSSYDGQQLEWCSCL